MARQSFVDLTDDAPRNGTYIDLTANGVEESSTSTMKKMNKLKADSSDGRSIIENPPMSKDISSTRPRFAFKSSSTKSQSLTTKACSTPKVDKDKPYTNGTHQKSNIGPPGITQQSTLRAKEQTPKADRPSPKDKQVQIPETPPRTGTLTPALNGSSKNPEGLGAKIPAIADKEGGLAISANLEAIRYDFVSLEVSLEAYKAALQKVLADVHKKHQTHVQRHLLGGMPGARPRRKFISTGSITVQKGGSPFAGIKGQQSIALSKPRSSLQLGTFESTTGHRSKKLPHKVCMPRTLYSSSDDTLPLSDEYVSTTCNVLTANEDFPTQVPFQGDYAFVDSDYQELESLILENRASHIVRLESGEKALFYRPFLKDVLRCMGCSIVEVLYYLIDDTSPIAPFDLPTSLLSLWTDREMYLEDGYFSEADMSDHDSRNDEPSYRRPQVQWTGLLKHLRKLAEISHKSATALACSAFGSLTALSLWQVLRIDETVLSMLSSSSVANTGLDDYSSRACLSCFMHNCPGHGELSWEDKENPTKDWNLLNAIPLEARHKLQTESRGMNKDEAMSGKAWTSSGRHDASFHDDEVCSPECYWLKRHETMPVSSLEEPNLFSALLPAYAHAPRAPCIVALATGESCTKIFQAMLQTTPNSIVTREHNELAAPKHSASYSTSYWQEYSETWRAELRPPFIPCNHAGPCSESADCSCFRNLVTCEKSCMCASACARRLTGCKCDGRVCGDKRYCECARLNRECDPDLCRKCGVREALNPAHRHPAKRDLFNKYLASRHAAGSSAKCRNSAIQRGIPCRTILGDSKMLADAGLKGWGLYAGEEVYQGDYVGEYTGEVISNEEGDRRGTVYDMRQMSYLFCLNKEQWIDSTYFGNKTRFINHQAKNSANVEPRILLCNMVHRIGMFAKRKIESGEELFFDYGTFFTRKFELVAVQEQEKTVLKNPREGLSGLEKPKRGRKSKNANNLVSQLASLPSLPPLNRLSLQAPSNDPPPRKRAREKDSSPVRGPAQKRRRVRTQFGKRVLDTESEYGETAADDGEEVSIADEDSTGDVEEEIADEDETESIEEPDEDDEDDEDEDDEVSEEDVTPVRRKAPAKKMGFARRKPRKGPHRTEAARKALADERLRLQNLAARPRTRSNSAHGTPVSRTRSARGTPDERPRASLAAAAAAAAGDEEQAKAMPRSGLMSKVARKGRR